jgi:hypothetical protein
MRAHEVAEQRSAHFRFFSIPSFVGGVGFAAIVLLVPPWARGFIGIPSLILLALSFVLGALQMTTLIIEALSSVRVS